MLTCLAAEKRQSSLLWLLDKPHYLLWFVPHVSGVTALEVLSSGEGCRRAVSWSRQPTMGGWSLALSGRSKKIPRSGSQSRHLKATQ